MPSVVIQLNLSHYLEVGQVPLVHQDMLPLGRLVTESGRTDFSLATPSQKDKLPSWNHQYSRSLIHPEMDFYCHLSSFSHQGIYSVCCHMCVWHTEFERVLFGYISLKQKNNSK